MQGAAVLEGWQQPVTATEAEQQQQQQQQQQPSAATEDEQQPSAAVQGQQQPSVAPEAGTAQDVGGRPFTPSSKRVCQRES